MKKRILFICVHNSARSQMAEAFVNLFAGDTLEAESAGLEPGKLNPVVVEVMKEIGVDISHKKTRSVNEVLKSERVFDYVITVCDESNAKRCPLFPGKALRLHWSFEDPSSFSGTQKVKVEKIRLVRDSIKQKVQNWIKTIK